MIGVGDQLGERYRVESRLGAGAMGVVWKAHDQRLRRTVAIKELVLRPGLDEAEIDRINRRAIREGRITARLQHPHAISVYDVIEQDSQVCLILEYLPSASLADVLGSQGVLPSGEVAEIGRQIASALSMAHDAGVVHRDIKPGNVLIADNGTAKVTDFGISRGLDDLATTSTGLFAGTIAYLAPEVAQGSAAGFPADVFSLGATLYAAVVGTPPFGLDENVFALLHRVAFGEVPPPSCSAPLQAVLMRMLDRRPDDRLTMSQARDELAAVVAMAGAAEPTAALGERASSAAVPGIAAAQPEQALPPTSSFEAASPPDDRARQKKALLVAVAGVIVLVALGALILGLVINNGTTQAAPPPSVAPPPQATSAPVPPPPTGGTSSQASPTSAAPPTSNPPTSNPPSQPESASDALVAYYALIPGNLPEGWNRLTERYKQATVDSFPQYEGFFAPMERVEVSQVQSSGDGRQVTATIRYVYKDGRAAAESRTYGLVLVGGQWLIDSSSVISSHSGG